MSFKPEDIDIESFLNLDSQFHSPSLINLNKGKGVVLPQTYQQPAIQNINTYAPQISQTFSGPSHQYDLHKQHIPLPPGALENSYSAVQPGFQFNGYSSYNLGSNVEFFDEYVDFNSMNGHRPSYSASNDMDMEFDSPVDGLYPNQLGEDSPIPRKAEIPVRVYPGMHAQQAQQAALAKQQQQNEIQRRQALKNAQPQAAKASISKASVKGPVDPVIEENISRILNQMRQTVNVPSQSLNDDQSSPPTMGKYKKDEEDMDEDERLLASEEGKKLSSKERRQLRNKVSARAFRSRRKEYIGQLEGEVAQKSSEADTLRAENEALKAENTRLTDLTKLLLSSSAFSSFLNDLSTNGLPASILAPIQTAPSATPERQQSQTPTPTPQPAMNTIVEEEIDFNSLDAESNWSSGMDFSFAPQVFAVTELPEVPIVDVAALSGKASELPEIFTSSKEMLPVIEVAPIQAEQQYSCDDSIEFDESDSAFALFAAAPERSAKLSYEIFGSISFEKATETIELVSESSNSEDDVEVSDSAMARFESLSASLESMALSLDGLMLN